MESKTPFLSVCIANYNGESIISECIDSIIRQKKGCTVEIIVHDDASTDQSVFILESRYPQIKLIKSESNVGFCAANNRMVNVAQGQYLLLLNNDAVLFDDAITAFTDAIETNPNAIYGLPQYNAANEALIDRGMFVDPFMNPLANLDPNIKDVALVSGSCLWIPKKMWDEIEGFPSSFEALAEDLYLCLCARLAGYEVCVLATSGYWHRVGYSLGGGKVEQDRFEISCRRRLLTERNKLMVMLMVYPWAALIFLTPCYLVALVLEAVLLCVMNFSFSPLKNIYIPLLKVAMNIKCWMVCRMSLREKIKISRWVLIRIIKFRFFKLESLIKYGVPTVK